MSEPSAIGIIGAGQAVRNLHAPVLANAGDRWQVTSVAASTAASAHSAAAGLTQVLGSVVRAVTVDEMMADDDIEAVLIAVPISAAPDFVEQALRSGKDVLTEKPLAPTSKIGRHLLAIARAEQRVLVVAENHRYRSTTQRLRGLVQSEAMGRPHLYVHQALQFREEATSNWRKHTDHPAGYLLDGGIHAIAEMRTIVGRDPAELSAVGHGIRPEFLGGELDTVVIAGRFDPLFLFQLSISYSAVHHGLHGPAVYGNTGTAVAHTNFVEVWSPGGPLFDKVNRRLRRPTGHRRRHPASGNGVADVWRRFGDLRRSEHPGTGAEEELADLELLDRILEHL